MSFVHSTSVTAAPFTSTFQVNDLLVGKPMVEISTEWLPLEILSLQVTVLTSSAPFKITTLTPVAGAFSE